MHQDEELSTGQHVPNDSGLQNLSTGARHLARQLREMGSIPAPDSILPAIEARLNLEYPHPLRPEFIEELTQAIRDDQWQVRSTAACVIGSLGGQAPRELVVAASRDPDPRVRVALLQTLGKQDEDNSLYRVAMLALRHDDNSKVRIAAAEALGSMGILTAMKVLEKILITDDDAEVRSVAARVIRKLRERKEPTVEHSGLQSLTVQQQATLIVEHALKRLEDHAEREVALDGKKTPPHEKTYPGETYTLTLAKGQLGPYKLLNTLGSGGYAEVYRGKHVILGTEAAVKVLHTPLLHEQIAQFVHEARTVAKLEHPNIVRVLNFDVTDHIPFLVMEYAPNGTLRQCHSRGTSLPLDKVITYVDQIAEALQYAHNQGVIHRDIKPENMLLGNKGEVLLSDFGIAIGSQSTSAQITQDIVGTIAYMAPEQIQGKPTPASDQYALGVIVYEWLSGSHPFEGDKWEVVAQHLSNIPPSLRIKAPHVPLAVEEVVMRALAKKPDERYESISAFARALSRASKQTAHVNKRERSNLHAKRLGKRGPKHLKIIWILVVLFFLLGLLAGTILLSSYPTTVTITPVSVPLVQIYTLSAVSASPSASPPQAHARFISATSPPESQVVQATGIGETRGTRAQGTLTFFNGLSIAQTVSAGTLITNTDGVQVVIDEDAVVPPADPPSFGSVTVPAHAVSIGTRGNIAAYSISQTCCTGNNSITVKNLSAFSGGQDPQPYTFVQQSDIDRAATLLEAQQKIRAQALLQGQVQPDEGIVNSIQCTHTVYSNHIAEDKVATFTVTTTLTCNGEVYDRENAMTIATELLKADAVKQLRSDYSLKGIITTRVLQATLERTQPLAISLLIQARGVWTFQFKAAVKGELARLIAGKSEKDAHNLLLKQAGIARVEFQTPWWVPWIIHNTLPMDSERIRLVISSHS